MWWLFFVYLLLTIVHASVNRPGLSLTDFIECGKLDHFSGASRVNYRTLYSEIITSYSGFIRISQEYNRHLFFWYFPCENRIEAKPLVLWLEGEIGKSGMNGVFSGVGPYNLNRDNTAVIYNTNTWTKEFNVLFIDSPIGAGFSSADSKLGYSTNITSVAKHLHVALGQFYQAFSQMRQVPLYIAGGLFAAKYATALTKEMEESKPKKIDLQGLILVNPFVDADFNIKASGLLRQMGLVNQVEYLDLRDEETAIANLVNQGSTLAAYDRYESYLERSRSIAGLRNLYNLYEEGPNFEDKVKSFLARPDIRNALHVGNRTIFGRKRSVKYFLKDDILTSAKNELEIVADSHKVLFLTGNMDPQSSPASIELLLNDFDYDEAITFRLKLAEKYIFDSRVEGYKRKGQRLSSVVLRNCGYFIFYDCGYQASEVVVQFVKQAL